MSQTLKQTLAKLNRNLKEEDQFKLASDVPKEYFDITYCSTGSPYLDFCISGIPYGHLTIMSGWEGSGKSTEALIAGREMQNETGKVLIYYDSERSVTNDHIDRLGVNRQLFLHRKESNLEKMLDEIQEFSMTSDIGMIILDSIKMFVSSTVEEKSAEEHNMSVEARKFNARMPIIESNCARRNIALVCVNQWRESPNKLHGDPRYLPGGSWQKYQPKLHLDFTKRDLIKDENKNVIGHNLDVRIKKSKSGAFDGKEVIPLKLYYGFGFDEMDDYADIFLENGVIDVAGGGNYTLPNGEKIRGKEKLISYFRDNEEYVKTLINETRGNNSKV